MVEVKPRAIACAPCVCGIFKLSQDSNYVKHVGSRTSGLKLMSAAAKPTSKGIHLAVVLESGIQGSSFSEISQNIAKAGNRQPWQTSSWYAQWWAKVE